VIPNKTISRISEIEFSLVIAFPFIDLYWDKKHFLYENYISLL